MFVLYYAQKMQFRKVALITLCEAFANRIFWIQNCSQESVNGEKNVTKKLVQLSLFLKRHYLLFSHFYRFLHPVGTVQCVAMMKSFGFGSFWCYKNKNEPNSYILA